MIGYIIVGGVCLIVGVVLGVVGTIVIAVTLLARQFDGDEPGNGKLK